MHISILLSSPPYVSTHALYPLGRAAARTPRCASRPARRLQVRRQAAKALAAWPSEKSKENFLQSASRQFSQVLVSDFGGIARPKSASGAVRRANKKRSLHTSSAVREKVLNGPDHVLRVAVQKNLEDENNMFEARLLQGNLLKKVSAVTSSSFPYSGSTRACRDGGRPAEVQ